MEMSGGAAELLKQPEQLKQRVLQDLKKARVLSEQDEILFMELCDIPHAYVIFDQNYEPARQEILEVPPRTGRAAAGAGAVGITAAWRTPCWKERAPRRTYCRTHEIHQLQGSVQSAGAFYSRRGRFIISTAILNYLNVGRWFHDRKLSVPYGATVVWNFTSTSPPTSQNPSPTLSSACSKASRCDAGARLEASGVADARLRQF